MKVGHETYRPVKLVDIRLLDLGCGHEALDRVIIIVTRGVHRLFHELVDIDRINSSLLVLGRPTRAV